MIMFGRFSGRQKLLAYIATVLIVVIVFAFLAKTPTLAILMSMILGLLLFVSKTVWFPKGYAKYAKNRVRVLSLALAASATLSYGFWDPILESIVLPLLKDYFGIHKDLGYDSRSVVFIFLAFVIWVVNYYMRDSTAMGVHPNPVRKDIPDRTFEERFGSVCDALEDDIKMLDRALRWSYRYFVPLTAVVEVRAKSGIKKRTTDLLRAMYTSKERLFLLLGDPGSGKSVTLRRLCLDLLGEAKVTGKIPVYVNLREWKPSEAWSDDNPPTEKQLYDFVFGMMVNEKDIETGKFFRQYFAQLYETGRLYFLLDSFDEIPDVLDEKDDSTLIQKLSYVMYRFLKGARAKESQGVLASRYFRRPTSAFDSNVTLEIMPFDEERIIKVLKRSPNFSDSVVRELFTSRSELVPTARNPFMTNLIADFIEHSGNELPENQMELYSSFIDRTLNDCAERIEKANLTSIQVKSAATEIANAMFNRLGFEVPVSLLKEKCTKFAVEEVIGVLTYARLGRLGGQDDNNFSFAHRRFAEYFAVTSLFTSREGVDLSSIPSDSQWRDALVLYCEVASDHQAEKVAAFCWDAIKAKQDPQNISTIHCMRFLKDAFRGRRSAIRPFSKEFSDYLEERIDDVNSTQSTKLAVECLGLTSVDRIDTGVVKALSLGNFWISETAVKSCRHLPRISRDLRDRLIQYIERLSMTEFLNRRRALGFSLSLSDAFRGVKMFHAIRSFDVFFLLTGFLICSVAFSLPTIWALAISILGSALIRLPLFVRGCGLIGDFMAFPLRPMFVIVLLLLVLIVAKQQAYYPFLGSKTLGTAKSYDISFFDLSNGEVTGLALLSALLLLPTYKLMKYRLSTIRRALIVFCRDRQSWKSLIPMLITMALCMLAMHILEKYEVLGAYFIYVPLSLLAVPVLYFLARILVSETRGFLLYRHISLHLTYTRESVHSIVTQLLPHRRYLTRFIEHLEQNVREVSGQWPDVNILKVSKNEALIRLARLEEKWLGLDR